MRSEQDLDRRSRYLEAAMRLFAEHGYVGTTMDMVIAETGGSKATLYKHFPTKEDLVTGLMEQVADTVSLEMDDPTTSTLPLTDGLTAIARSTCQGVWSPGAAAVLRLCLGEYGRFPELAHTVWSVGPTRSYANFRAFLAERQRRGEVTVDDTQIAAEQFLGGLVGHLQLKIAFGMTRPPTQDEIDARVDSAVTTFLARYANPPWQSPP
jgi:TetR/AcrR family transcriptional regulator, mexJK operon transcriptional repressor